MRRFLFVCCLVITLVWGLIVSFKATDRWEKLYKQWESFDNISGNTIYIQGRVSSYDTESITLTDVKIRVNAANQQNIQTSLNLICNYDKITSPDNLLDVFAGEKLSKDKLSIGDYIEGSGVYYAYNRAENPGNFDACKYYLLNGYIGKVTNFEILKKVKDKKSPIQKLRDKVTNIRIYYEKKIDMTYDEPYAGTIKAMLMGDKTDVDKDLKKLYQKSGIIHILSISGLHISIIGMGLFSLLRRLGLKDKYAGIFGMVIMLLFGLMTGFGISSVRAIGMYCIRMLACLSNRTYDCLTALGIMCLLSVVSGMNCYENSGFYLSYLAVFGICLYGILIEDNIKMQRINWFVENKLKRKVAEEKNKLLNSLLLSLISGIVVTWITMPIILLTYYSTPVYSVIINLLVLPLMSMLVTFGFLSIIMKVLSFLKVFAWAILLWFEKLCNFFELIPCSVYVAGKPALWKIVLFYLVVVLWIIIMNWLNYLEQSSVNKKEKISKLNKNRERFICTFLCIVISVSVLCVKQRQTSIVFLSVGQGDCIFVETNEGKNFLFDCGSSSKKNLWEYTVEPFLNYYGVDRLDGIFLSHMDNDHINGILDFLSLAEESSIQIDKIYLGSNQKDEDSEIKEMVYENKQSKGKNVDILYLNKGQYFKSGDLEFYCLSPDEQVEYSDENAGSMCFLINFKETSLLLTGDVCDEGEDKLTKELLNFSKEGILRKERILKVAHHGSKGSSKAAFLKAFEPDTAIISCGKNNSYGHPHEETLERLNETGCRIYRTDNSGAVILSIKNNEILIKTMY